MADRARRRARTSLRARSCAERVALGQRGIGAGEQGAEQQVVQDRVLHAWVIQVRRGWSARGGGRPGRGRRTPATAGRRRAPRSACPGRRCAAVEHVEAVAEGRRQVEVVEARQGAQGRGRAAAQAPAGSAGRGGWSVRRGSAGAVPGPAREPAGRAASRHRRLAKGSRHAFETDLEQRLADPLAVVRAVAVEQALVRRAAHGDHVSTARPKSSGNSCNTTAMRRAAQRGGWRQRSSPSSTTRPRCGRA